MEGVSEPAPTYSVMLVLDKNDNPHIAYTDVKKKLIKYATRQNGKWQIEVVDTIWARRRTRIVTVFSWMLTARRI